MLQAGNNKNKVEEVQKQTPENETQSLKHSETAFEKLSQQQLVHILWQIIMRYIVKKQNLNVFHCNALYW